MKLLLLFGFLFAVTSAATVDKDPCSQPAECPQTKFSDYVKCSEKKRIKRQACPYATNVVVPAVPVQSCNGNSCGVVQPQCMNNCYNSCSGVACSDRCQTSCQAPNPVTPHVNTTTVVVKETGESSVTSPNVTTIIKLTNIVNNTNIVNVPTNINNTNLNNIQLETNSTSNNAASGKSEKCCVVVQPKVCHKVQGTGYKCFHRRHHTCGEQCISHTLHAQVRQKCVGQVSQCPVDVSYVPQPNPRCYYVPTWPYVSCGGGQTSCEGCYDHYGYGFHSYYGGTKPPQCQGCYDDGFQNTPLYRQGPYYQPSYYHTAPQVTPTCSTNGCFGNQMIDPVYAQPQSVQINQPQVVEQQIQYVPQPIQYVPQPIPQPVAVPQQIQYIPQPITVPQQVQYIPQPISVPQQVQYIPQPISVPQPLQYIPQPISQPPSYYYPQYQPSSYVPNYPAGYFESPEVIFLNNTSGNFSFTDDPNFLIDPNSIVPFTNYTLFNSSYPFMNPLPYYNPYYAPPSSYFSRTYPGFFPNWLNLNETVLTK